MYPIEQHISEVLCSLRDRRRCIVITPTGSGKSTILPIRLLQHVKKQLWLVQPRRAATRLVATRIAQLLSVELGSTVGYHIQWDNCSSAQTRLLVMTEGMLLQRLQRDPLLTDVSLIVLDEFHERSLSLDLALGFLQEVQEVQEELQVLCMSATLDPTNLLDYWQGGANVVRGSGRSYPVDIRYQRFHPQDRWKEMAQCIASIDHSSGNLLAFLPGVGEIHRVRDWLEQQFNIHPLIVHGRQSVDEQQQTLRLSEVGKVILSTNIAESSVTIPNVTHVVDSGLQKIAKMEDGLPRLTTINVTQDAADQRAGRAGRTQSGVCHRMWTQDSHSTRDAQRQPEVLHAPLEQAVLHLLIWGVDPAEFCWLTPPSPVRLNAALKRLEQSGILHHGSPTPIGRKAALLPTSPIVGLFLLRCKQSGLAQQGSAIATLLTEGLPRMPQQSATQWLSDIMNNANNVPFRWKRAHQRFLRTAIDDLPPRQDTLEHLLCTLFEERIAKHLSGGTYQCGSGRHRIWRTHPPHPDWIFVLSVSGDRIFSGLPLSEERLTTSQHLHHHFDESQEKVFCWRQQKIGQIVLRQQVQAIDPVKASQLLLEQARLRPEKALTIDNASLALLHRLRFVARTHPDLPAHQTWDELLEHLCVGRRSFAELRQINLSNALMTQLTWQQRRLLEERAPQHYVLPNRRKIRLQYPPDGPPVLATYIQQLFGLKQHPMLFDQPILVQLWAPNGRVQQQTLNLEAFWTGTYVEIRKELRGRYPKHRWPDPKDL